MKKIKVKYTIMPVSNPGHNPNEEWYGFITEPYWIAQTTPQFFGASEKEVREKIDVRINERIEIERERIRAQIKQKENVRHYERKIKL